MAKLFEFTFQVRRPIDYLVNRGLVDDRFVKTTSNNSQSGWVSQVLPSKEARSASALFSLSTSERRLRRYLN